MIGACTADTPCRLPVATVAGRTCTAPIDHTHRQPSPNRRNAVVDVSHVSHPSPSSRVRASASFAGTTCTGHLSNTTARTCGAHNTRTQCRPTMGSTGSSAVVCGPHVQPSLCSRVRTFGRRNIICGSPPRSTHQHCGSPRWALVSQIQLATPVLRLRRRASLTAPINVGHAALTPESP